MEKLFRKHQKTLIVSPNLSNQQTIGHHHSSILDIGETAKQRKLNESNHSIKSGFSINDGKDTLTPAS